MSNIEANYHISKTWGYITWKSPECPEVYSRSKLLRKYFFLNWKSTCFFKGKCKLKFYFLVPFKEQAHEVYTWSFMENLLVLNKRYMYKFRVSRRPTPVFDFVEFGNKDQKDEKAKARYFVQHKWIRTKFSHAVRCTHQNQISIWNCFGKKSGKVVF